MAYVDGFVVPVPKKNKQAYLRVARKAEKVWRRSTTWNVSRTT
jgi:uncharacterized protein YbaA (DUF1428 family)